MNITTIKIGVIKKFLEITLCAIKISAPRLINGGAPILNIAPMNQNRAIRGVSFSNPLVKIRLRELDFSYEKAAKQKRRDLPRPCP